VAPITRVTENRKKAAIEQSKPPSYIPKPASEPLRGFPTTKEIDDAIRRHNRLAHVPAPVTITSVPKSDK